MVSKDNFPGVPLREQFDQFDLSSSVLYLSPGKAYIVIKYLC